MAAHKWTYHFFGHGDAARLALCVAYTESRYELSPPPNEYLGPWQVSPYWHPWVNRWKMTRSWRYAAAVTYRLSQHGTDFSAWRGDCGIG